VVGFSSGVGFLSGGGAGTVIGSFSLGVLGITVGAVSVALGKQALLHVSLLIGIECSR